MTETEEIYQTIARFRLSFPGIEKKRYNSFTGSYYASLDDVWKVVEPHLVKAGLFVEQHTQDGVLFIRLYNQGGACLTSSVSLPDSSDGFQKFGGALTYFRRYLICLMLNVTEADHDDDGNAGEIGDSKQPIDERQLSSIYDLIEATETDQKRLLEYIESAYGAKRIEDLTYAQASIIRRMLSAKQEGGNG